MKRLKISDQMSAEQISAAYAKCSRCERKVKVEVLAKKNNLCTQHFNASQRPQYSLKASEDNAITIALRRDCWAKTNGRLLKIGRCFSCQTQIHDESFDVGHIISKKNGGPAILANLVPICKPCNSECRAKNLNDYMKVRHPDTFRLIPVSFWASVAIGVQQWYASRTTPSTILSTLQQKSTPAEEVKTVEPDENTGPVQMDECTDYGF